MLLNMVRQLNRCGESLLLFLVCCDKLLDPVPQLSN